MKIFKPNFYTEEDLETLDEDKIVFPFSDKDATYKGRYHQYELTKEYFTERNMNLEELLPSNNPEKVSQFLSELRIKFYTRIYTQCKATRQQINYLIAKRGLRRFPMYEYRQAFLEAMYLEGCYLLYNGDISMVAGVDLDTMQNMSVDVIRNQDRDFYKDSLGILAELGLNYRGSYHWMPRGEGEEW